MRVDLPAPLSPTRATTSPAWTSKSTPESASTAPNRLLTPLASSRGVDCAGVVEGMSVISGLLDPVLGAGLLVLGRADLAGLPVPVGDDGGLHRVGGDRLDGDLVRG